MIKSNSEYKISALCWLPQGGLLGKTYSIVTATEVGADLIKAEYFLLVQRPTAALHHDTFKIKSEELSIRTGAMGYLIRTG